MSTPERRREEARELLDMLEGYDDIMEPKDWDFYVKMVHAFDEYDDRARVSDSQLFWLRDLKARYAMRPFFGFSSAYSLASCSADMPPSTVKCSSALGRSRLRSIHSGVR